jgi:hypothetical protein
MIINCKLCPFQAKSLIVTKEQALAEVGAKLAKHLGEKHQEMIVAINQNGVKVGMLGMWLMTMNMATNIPEDETYILMEKDKREAEFMALMGFDKEPEGEETKDTEVKSEAD